MARSKSIKLSPKHGLNPSMFCCFICGKETGEIALLGKLKGDQEAPKYISNPNCLCDDCKKQIEAGNKFILEVKDGEKGPNPYRTGRLVCIKGTALPEIQQPIVYMEQTVFSSMFDEFIK